MLPCKQTSLSSWSEAIFCGVVAPRSKRLMGTIQDHEILIIVYPGSSHTFISSALATKLSGASALENLLQVKEANGTSIYCDSQFKSAKWELQGCEFCSDFKVISLQHFDVVLGYDWLEMFSPMEVHWSAKWMAIHMARLLQYFKVFCLNCSWKMLFRYFSCHKRIFSWKLIQVP
jgi:hypothetical protein